MAKKRQAAPAAAPAPPPTPPPAPPTVLDEAYTFKRTDQGRLAKGELLRAVGMARAAGQATAPLMAGWIKEHFNEDISPNSIYQAIRSEGAGGGGGRAAKVSRPTPEQLKYVRQNVE